MRHLLALVVALVVAGPVLALGSDSCGMAGQSTCAGAVPAATDNTVTAQAAPMAQAASTTQEAKKQYTCPMHPEVIADKPGKCPKCGMNLVEKKADKANKDAPKAHNHDDMK